MSLNSNQLKPLVSDVLRAGLVPFVAGSPGIGKSDLIANIAKHFNLKLIDHRLSTSDPTDLSGFPSIVEGRADYIPFELFPVEGTEVPEGYDGWLLFLDEFNSAPMSVQAAAYKLSLDRMVGQHKLHEKCACITAGNKETDGAIVNRLSTAMQSRLVHFEMDVDSDAWLGWAYENNVDSRVTSFINYAPEKLHMFDPAHNDKTFPCPRTWHFISRVIGSMSEITSDKLPILEGTIGKGVSREFLQYCDIGSQLPSFAEIIKDPKGTKLPDEPSTMYFICGTVASKAEPKVLDKLITFIERMPIEFQIVCFRDMLKRDKTLKAEKPLRGWIMKNSSELFD